MKIELTKEEAQNTLAAINAAIKVSENAIESSAALLPIVGKISEAMKSQPPAEEDTDG